MSEHPTVREYLRRYQTPLGYLLVSWTVVYLVIAWFVVVVRGESFGTPLLLGSGLEFALVVSFIADRER